MGPRVEPADGGFAWWNLEGSRGDSGLLFEQHAERWAARALDAQHPHVIATSREGPEGAGMVEQCSGFESSMQMQSGVRTRCLSACRRADVDYQRFRLTFVGSNRSMGAALHRLLHVESTTTNRRGRSSLEFAPGIAERDCRSSGPSSAAAWRRAQTAGGPDRLE